MHGKLIGGGIAACLQTDYVVAAEGATFEHGNLVRGLCPLGQLSQTFVHAVGRLGALEAYLQNVTIGATLALAAGLVHEVRVSGMAARQRSREVAESLRPQPRLLLGGRVRIDQGIVMREAVAHAECSLAVGGMVRQRGLADVRASTAICLREVRMAGCTPAHLHAPHRALSQAPSSAMGGKSAAELAAELSLLRLVNVCMASPGRVGDHRKRGSPALAFDASVGVALLELHPSTTAGLVAVEDAARGLSSFGSALCVLILRSTENARTTRSLPPRLSERSLMRQHAVINTIRALNVPVVFATDGVVSDAARIFHALSLIHI